MVLTPYRQGGPFRYRHIHISIQIFSLFLLVLYWWPCHFCFKILSHHTFLLNHQEVTWNDRYFIFISKFHIKMWDTWWKVYTGSFPIIFFHTFPLTFHMRIVLWTKITRYTKREIWYTKNLQIQVYTLLLSHYHTLRNTKMCATCKRLLYT